MLIFNKKIGGLIMIYLIIGILLIVGITFSHLKLIKPDQMIVRQTLGREMKVLDSGIRLSPTLIPFSMIELYGKKDYSIKDDRLLLEFLSEGKQKAEGEQKESFEKIPLKVKFVFYYSFPQSTQEEESEKWKKDLKKIYTILPSPSERESLEDWFIGKVLEAIRKAISGKNWVAVTESGNEGTISAHATEELKEEMEELGLHFHSLKINLEDIDVPQELKESLTEKEASQNWSSVEGEKLAGDLMEAFSKLKGKTRERLQKEIEENPEKYEDLQEFLREIKLKKMEVENGGYFKFISEGNDGLSEIISEVAKFKKALDKMPSGKSDSHSSSSSGSDSNEGSSDPTEMSDEEFLNHLKQF